MQNQALLKQARALQYDSRFVDEGDLFFAVKGLESDGNQFVQQAKERGCIGVVSEASIPQDWDLPWIQVPDVREAMAQAAQLFYNFPDKQLKLIGVTGTNGKSTVTTLLKHALDFLGNKTGLLGTLQYDLGSRICAAIRTTPESIDLFRYFREMVDSGCNHCVMEVSSHALVLKRIFGVHFHTAAFTNISQDHLDFHGDMAAYLDAKMSLFDGRNGFKPKHSVLYNAPEVAFSNLQLTSQGSEFSLIYKDQTLQAVTSLIGEFNVQNYITAIQVLLKQNYSLQDCIIALRDFKGAPGRMQPVSFEQDFSVIVDYAHTPDALEKVLKTIRQFTLGNIHTVFGCGGDRDQGKRQYMAQVARQFSDHIYPTSDNPRYEDQDSIFEDMQLGNVVTFHDRKQAIKQAIRAAKPNDTVVIAGKGHEQYQEIQGVKYPFDDVQVAQDSLLEHSY